jgi:hypothetical protein
MIFEKEWERNFRLCIQPSPSSQYAKPKVSLPLFLKHHLETSIQNRKSLSLSFSNIERESLSVLYTGYQVMFEKGGERLSVLYTGYQVMFEKERQRDFRFCILVTRWYLRKRERDTFDFAYWLRSNFWKRERHHLVTSI